MMNSNVSDYHSYRAEKYDCVKNGNAAISSAYLGIRRKSKKHLTFLGKAVII